MTHGSQKKAKDIKTMEEMNEFLRVFNFKYSIERGIPPVGVIMDQRGDVL